MMPLIFLHIPKTAGTSFRVAAEEWFGKRHLMYDYGPQARRTSSIFRRVETGEVSWEKALEKVKCARFVTGHFPAQRYHSAFGPEHFCTFVRDPVERAVSQYFHHKHALGYAGNIETFIEDIRFHDQQHRLLLGLPLERMGFVGVTESYPDSLEIFNARFGTSLKIAFHNQRESRTSEDPLSPELINRIEQLNARDLKLYRLAQEMLERRLIELENRP